MLHKIGLTLMMVLLLTGCTINLNLNGDGDSHNLKRDQKQTANSESPNDRNRGDQAETKPQNPMSDQKKAGNYPWWRHSVQDYEKNITFISHRTKGSDGKYTIDLTVTCPPEYKFYYDVFVVDSHGKHEVIKKKEISLPQDASYRPEHITFAISIPARLPQKGLAYAVLYKLDEKGNKKDAIRVKLETWE